MSSHSLASIAAALGGDLCGADVPVSRIAPLERAGEGEISFVAHAKYRRMLDSTRAAALILPRSLQGAHAGPHILADNPQLYFAQVAQLLHPAAHPALGVHPSAVVLSPVPADASIGPLSFIGENCVIGAGVIVGAGCTIQSGCMIGAGTLLHDRVSLYANSKVGERAILHSGCVIGSDGFGYARHRDGSWEKIPQIGRAILGDEVEIGANVTIDRGAMDDTVIGNGVKLDNMVHIAHNVRLGEHTAMAGQSGVAGSSTVGRRVMVGGQSGVLGHIEIADDVVLSGRSLASKSVSEACMLSSALPAQNQAEWNRNSVHLRHLDEMAKRIRALEKKLEELEKPE